MPVTVTQISGPAAGDPLALEPGPLGPIDPETMPRVRLAANFSALVAGAHDQIAGATGGVDPAREDVAGHASGATIDGAYGWTLGDADGQLAGHVWALGAADPSDIAAATNDQAAAADSARGDYDEPPPPPPSHVDPPHVRPIDPWLQ